MTLTGDDLREVEAVTDRLRECEQAISDLADRCTRKGDRARGAQLTVKALWRGEHARQEIEELFA